MKVEPELFREYLLQASFKDSGDVYERRFGHYVIKEFPNCQRYWQNFVVPITERIDGYPESMILEIYPRQDIDIRIQDISSIHYSAFLHLVYAHIHFDAKLLTMLEDFYVHLGSACDLIETFIEKWYLLLLICRGEKTETLQLLSRDEFLKRAGNLYDKRYAGLYEYYLSKGRSYPLHLPSRQDILKECMEDYFNQADLWKEYTVHSKQIREFRNVVVHDIQIGKIIVNGTEIFIPKPSVIQQYRTWREIVAIANDEIRVRRDFSPISQQLPNDLEKLENIANRIWEIIMAEVDKEFYSRERNTLRELYQIEI